MGNLTASKLLIELAKEKQTHNKKIINIITGSFIICGIGTNKEIIHDYICSLIGAYTDAYITKQMIICGYTLTNNNYNCKLW